MDCLNYTHMKCKCGGIIGMYDREHFTCGKCGKNYDVMDIILMTILRLIIKQVGFFRWLGNRYR